MWMCWLRVRRPLGLVSRQNLQGDAVTFKDEPNGLTDFQPRQFLASLLYILRESN